MRQESAIRLATCFLWLWVCWTLERVADVILLLAKALEWATDIVVTLHDWAEGHLDGSLAVARAAVECLEKERQT